MCNTVRVHYSRWRYARGCLANRQHTLKGRKKRKTLHHQLGYICLRSLCRCRAHLLDSGVHFITLLPFLFAPSRQPSTVYSHACFGLNMMVAYYAGTVASTPPVDRARAHMKRAQDNLFKWGRARCPSRECLCSHRSNELDFGVKACYLL